MSEFKPEKIIVSKAKDKLTLVYKMRDRISLSAEYLRVYSPSAEVRGHHPSDHVLQYGKKNVRIINVKKVGLYAIQLVFDDGHDSGIYSWDYILSLKKKLRGLLEELPFTSRQRESISITRYSNLRAQMKEQSNIGGSSNMI